MKQRTKKIRADIALVEQGLAETRTRAQALILAGQVFRDETRIEKPGLQVDPDLPLRLKESPRYVSRGGLKLESALDQLDVTVSELVCADVGASTGGFTDCLLQRGAQRVYAIDVGRGLLAHKLVGDERVVVMDQTNARFLTRATFPEPIQLCVVDASFISLEKLLPAIRDFLGSEGQLIAMIKPQFEVGREQARRSKGVIRDRDMRSAAIEGVKAEMHKLGFELVAACDSKVAGPKGNVEHFVWARLPSTPQTASTQIS